jgi:DNA polymerase-3 subunit beta
VRLVADRDVLLKALGRVRGAIPARHTVPIVSSVKVEVEDAVVRLTGTNLDLWIAAEAALNVGEDGATTIPAAMLHDVLTNLRSGTEVELRIGKGESAVTLTSGRTRCKLPALAAADYPMPGKQLWLGGGEIVAPHLARLIDKTRYAVEVDGGRFALCGVYFEPRETDGGWQLQASATDGHRVARASVAADECFSGFPGVAPPTKTVDEMRRLIEGAELAELYARPGMIELRVASAVLTSKVIDEAYSSHDRLIGLGGEPPHTATVGVEALRDAIKLALSAVAGDKDRLIAADLNGDTLTISAAGMWGGQVVGEVEVAYQGPPTTLGLNGSDILQALATVEAESVEIVFGDNLKPIFLRDPDSPEVVSLATTAIVHSLAQAA